MLAHLAEQALDAVERLPDLTLFVDVSPATAIERIRRSGGPVDWKERPEFLVAARELYYAILAQESYLKHNIVRIDGERNEAAVTMIALNHITSLKPQ